MKYGILNIKNFLKHNRNDYKYGLYDWFFPQDLSPHNKALKYSCKKLYEKGLLERSVRNGRYGYQYKLKKELQENK